MKIWNYLAYLACVAGMLLIVAIADAHPGRLDKYGGHYDKNTGTYHTHTTTLDTLEIRRNTIYKAHVDRVIDGDTIVVSFIFDDGSEYQQERVRFIGLDTPEVGVKKVFDVGEKQLSNTEKSFVLYGDEAKEYTTEALTDKIVWLETETDVKDMYGRMLAYIWLKPPEDDEAFIRENMFNAKLLLEGYAKLLTIAPNGKYTKNFTKYLEEAQYTLKGFWGN